MTDAQVHLVAQPRLDTVVTGYFSDARQLRTDYAGIAWLGDQPPADGELMGSDYGKRQVDSRLFLPDTHWYALDAVEDIEVQVTSGLLQIPGTSVGSQGLVGALAEPLVEFFEHPEGLEGVGVCLRLHGTIWSNVGLSYRVSVLSAPEAVIRPGTTGHDDDTD